MPSIKSQFIKSKVYEGEKLGRKIGFPTVNLDPGVFTNHKEGVYSCSLLINNKLFRGVLYYGPRLVLGETKNVLEINIMNFNEEIYGKIIEFKADKFCRPPKKFTNLIGLKEQLKKDILCT